MQVIPVIDLKGSGVVHARRGQRELYRPIETPLARSSDPVDVAAGLLSLHPFDTFYVADLDAIAGTGDNRIALDAIKCAFPNVSLWLDNGIADLRAAKKWLDEGLGYLVAGSETQTEAAVVEHFSKDERVVLSLDFRGNAFQGPPALLANPEIWPKRVIVMTLDRVGSHAGPDLERLRAVKDAAPGRAIYAAGGVRDCGDLRALAQAGIAGALVASSLHNGHITAAGLQRLSRQARPASRL